MSKKTSKKATNKKTSATSASSNDTQTKNSSASKDTINEKPSVNESPLADEKLSESNKLANNKKPSGDDTPPLTEKQTSADKGASTTQSSLPKPPLQQTGTQTVQSNTNKSNSGLSVFAILISLAALGATGFSWYLTHIKNINSNTGLAIGVTQISGQVTRISDSVTRLQSEQSKVVTQAQLTSKLLEANTPLDRQIRDLKQTQSQLSESLTKVNESLQKGANQYVIDEVSQLLKLGNHSAIFSGDVESAIKAFTLADIQLKELANPRFSEVRRKINDEILLLKSIKQIDTENILAKLNAVSNKINQLPLENEPPVVTTAEKNIATNNTETTWRSELNRMWSDILNSVTIQKVDQPPKPLLVPQERYFLNQNIQLQLTKAEIALLQNRQTVFSNSITEATTWLNDYFDLSNKQVKDALQELKQLQSISLNSDLPSVAGSYDLLQSIKGGQ